MPDILCLSEHWLSPHEHTSFQIPDFINTSLYYITSSAHGGVAVLTRPHIKAKPFPGIEKHCIDKIFECAGATLISENNIYITLSIYRSPSGEIEAFLASLEGLLTYASKLMPKAHILLAGDFNIDLFQTTKSTTNFLDLLLSFQLSQTINSPTRITKSTSTLIDNIFTNLKSSQYTSKTFESGLSDHLALQITIPIIVTKTEPDSFVYKRTFSETSYEQFYHYLSMEQWTNVYQLTDPSNMFDCFIKKFKFHFNNAFPIRKRKNRPPDSNNWIRCCR
jgi:hypothetical protein